MAGEYYLWSVDGKPVSVLLGLSVVERLGALIHHSSESYGVLLGAVLARGRHPAIVVDDFEPFDTAPEQLDSIRDRIPVGLFHSRPDGDLRLDRDDAGLVERLFHQPDLIYLLVQPASGEPSKAAFFIQEKGKMQGFSPYRTFPFHAPLLRSGGYPLTDGRARPGPSGLSYAAKGAAVMVLAAAAILGGWSMTRPSRKPPTAPAPPAIVVVEQGKVSPLQPSPQVLPEEPAPAPIPRVVKRRTALIGIETVPPGRMSRIVGRIPGVRTLTRVRYNSGDRFSPPQVVHRALPAVSDATPVSDQPIDVRLRVDPRGRTSILRIATGTGQPELTRLAADAAKRWRFEPARLNGRAVSSDIILRFTFPRS